MKKFFLAGLALALSAMTFSPPALAASHRTRVNPSTLEELNAVTTITARDLHLALGTSCADSSPPLVTFTGTIRNLTSDRTIRAVRAIMTWSFVDAFQANDTYSVEWDQVTLVPPGGTRTLATPDDWNINCNDRAQAAVMGQMGGPALKFSYTPLEVVFTNHQRIGPPPSN